MNKNGVNTNNFIASQQYYIIHHQAISRTISLDSAFRLRTWWQFVNGGYSVRYIKVIYRISIYRLSLLFLAWSDRGECWSDNYLSLRTHRTRFIYIKFVIVCLYIFSSIIFAGLFAPFLFTLYDVLIIVVSKTV